MSLHAVVPSLDSKLFCLCLQDLLKSLVQSRQQTASAGVHVSQAIELQIKLVVFSQLTLQRFFDEIPIAARAFLVHKVCLTNDQ